MVGCISLPREKYETDNNFRVLVQYMMYQINACQFTPSELREAVVLASIMYAECHTVPQYQVVQEGDFHIEYVDSEIVRLTPLGEITHGTERKTTKSG